MNVLVWLDVPLVVLGLLAISPWLWRGFRRWRSVCPPSLGRVMQTATVLLFYLGLASLTMAGIDVGVAAWERAHRPSCPINHTVRETIMAPDFCLPSLDEDSSVRLSDFRGQKPVVLIFGSFG